MSYQAQQGLVDLRKLMGSVALRLSNVTEAGLGYLGLPVSRGTLERE
ncbi:rCG63484 [Rattus norvegicus]|uniref:RCG63484 n=1 Tax=Rattus norvegicus TaxID=10116 RepID=A6HJS3_RAT|nr:rCG63484 [Rattus norvegicus]